MPDLDSDPCLQVLVVALAALECLSTRRLSSRVPSGHLRRCRRISPHHLLALAPAAHVPGVEAAVTSVAACAKPIAFAAGQLGFVVGEPATAVDLLDVFGNCHTF